MSEIACAAFRGFGIRSEVVPLPDSKVLGKGRANTSCKECLPLILTTGSMVDYAEGKREDDELTLYFMPTGTGGCRLPQYCVHLGNVIEKRKIKNLATFTLTSANSYGGLGTSKAITMLKGVIIGDIMDDIKNSLCVLAVDPRQAARVFDQQWQTILECFATGCKGMYRVLRRVADRLSAIQLKHPITKAKKVLMAGEADAWVRALTFS